MAARGISGTRRDTNITPGTSVMTGWGADVGGAIMVRRLVVGASRAPAVGHERDVRPLAKGLGGAA